LYIQKELRDRASEICRLIFDFDGVLVQTFSSFRKNIVKVVNYYFKDILGLDEECEAVSLSDVNKFKDTGLFNNDWYLTYALTLYLLASLFRKLKLKGLMEDFKLHISTLDFTNLEDYVLKLRAAGNKLRSYGIRLEDIVKEEGSKYKMENFLSRCSSGDPEAVRVTLKDFFPEPALENVALADKMALYRKEGSDLLRRLFEESYLGAELFSLFYGEEPYFKFEESFMAKEKFIPTMNTLKTLYDKTGKFSIYSERSRAQALYHLERNSALEFFEDEWLIFFDDIAECEKTLYEKCGRKLSLGKPNPTLFIKLLEKCSCDGLVGYIGDSVSDLLTVVNARGKGIKNICFIGVLSSAEDKESLQMRYVELGADIIINDVNDLPSIIG